MSKSIESSLLTAAELSGLFTDVAAAARAAAPLCQLDAAGNVVPTDARSNLQSIMSRIAVERPETAKAAPPRGNMVTDPGVLRLLAEDTDRRKSLDALKGIFGRGSDSARAAALMRSDPGQYRRLKSIAISAGIL